MNNHRQRRPKFNLRAVALMLVAAIVVSLIMMRNQREYSSSAQFESGQQVAAQNVAPDVQNEVFPDAPVAKGEGSGPVTLSVTTASDMAAKRRFTKPLGTNEQAEVDPHRDEVRRMARASADAAKKPTN